MMANIKTAGEHTVAYLDLVALVNRNADKLTAVELLAIGANMVGKLVAFQDQNTVTPERAWEIIRENIVMGNQEAVDQLMKHTAGHA